MTLSFNLRGVVAAALAAGLAVALASAASATPRLAKRSDIGVERAGATLVHYRRHRHHHHHHGRVVVDAPYTSVTRRNVVVGAPYADVRVRRGRGVYVSAPFVELRVAR